MLHKMGVLFRCEECKRAVMEDEDDWETDCGQDLCGDCVRKQATEAFEKWFGKPKEQPHA
jgi:hypothetical protein